MARKILLAVGLLIAVLLLGAAGGYAWLRHQAERAEQSPADIRQFFSLPAQRPAFAAADRVPCRDRYPLRHAWFGDTHIHTAVSYDATAFGVTNGPDDAYAFARGEAVELRLQDDPPAAVVPTLQLPRPLDFAAVTDHAEGLGEAAICDDPLAPGHDAAACALYRGDWRLPVDESLFPLVRLAALAIFGQHRSARICGADGTRCRAGAEAAWVANQQAAERWYDRSASCAFTTFVGYEYSLAEEGANLHRNVIFANAEVPPRIMSARDANTPEELWHWLQRACLDGGESCDVLAIPHNSDWSSGRMWFPYSLDGRTRDEQRADAELRSRIEVLAEIMQVKGDSECRNGLPSILGEPDEFCEFEKLRPADPSIEDCGDTFGSGGMSLQGCESRFSYVRYALAAGLQDQRVLGVNPFRLGIIAATDNHNGTSAAEFERGHLGATGQDRDAVRRLTSGVEVPGGIAKGSPVRYGPGGLAGVWAEENTRESLFAAMRRRETFGTSGPRIQPRFFAAADYPEDICEAPDMVATAYRLGVAMGGEIGGEDWPGGSPEFLLAAHRDPLGNPLQRIQVIKAWVDEQGRAHQAVHDVAGDPGNGAWVDDDTCEVHGDGYAQLCATWRDPAFQPGVAAVYYARVLENPSCRWSTWDCNSLPAGQRPPTCDDPTIPKAIQERAWTSPIWYAPPG